MSKEQFDDNCKGCKPVLLDVKTRKVLPDDHPNMIATKAIWDQQTLETKQAWHRVTCQNSRDVNDMNLAENYSRLVEKVLNDN